jgi:hypothetical protein
VNLSIFKKLKLSLRMKTKMINFKSVSEMLSEKELKNVLGGSGSGSCCGYLKYFIYIFLILFLNQGCNPNSDVSDIPVIDIENELTSGKILNLKDYAESINYVKLNTTEDGLLALPIKWIYEDGLFIIRDRLRNNVSLFHENGSFIKTIGKKGQGPLEYLLCSGIDYLSDSKEILLHAMQKVFFYDSEGNYIRQFKLNFDIDAVHGIRFFFNPSIFAGDIYATPDRRLKLLFFNDSSQIVKRIPHNNPLLDYSETTYPGLGGEIAVMYRFEDHLVHYKPYEDTIFCIDKGMNIKAKYIINYGKYKTFDTYNQLEFYVENIFESSGYLFFNIFAGRFVPEKFFEKNIITGKEVIDPKLYGVYNKKEKKLTFLNRLENGKLGFKNDVDGGLPFWPKYISTKGEMITYYQPYEFMVAFQNKKDIPEDVKAILKDLKEDDNPIVAIAKLK